MRIPRAVLAPTAAVLLLGAPVALAVTSGTYKGKLDPGGDKITIKVKSDRVTSFKGSIYASCGLSNLIITVAYPPAGAKKGTSARISGGRFKVTYRSDPTVAPEKDKRTLSGTFKGSKVTGAVKITGLCSASGTYSAKR